MATSDDDIGRDPLLLGNAEPGQFRLRVGVCCSPSTPWVGSYRVTFNVEPNSLPVTTTTVAVTTTTVAVTTTTRPPANPQITSDSLSRSSLVLAPDINSNAVYWTVNMTDSLGRLPGTAGAQLCAPGSSPGIGPWCTGATMSRSGTGFAASYTGLFLISNSADRGSWYPSVFWPVGQASEYQIAGTARISIT